MMWMPGVKGDLQVALEISAVWDHPVRHGLRGEHSPEDGGLVKPSSHLQLFKTFSKDSQNKALHGLSFGSNRPSEKRFGRPQGTHLSPLQEGRSSSVGPRHLRLFEASRLRLSRLRPRNIRRPPTTAARGDWQRREDFVGRKK